MLSVFDSRMLADVEVCNSSIPSFFSIIFNALQLGSAHHRRVCRIGTQHNAASSGRLEDDDMVMKHCSNVSPEAVIKNEGMPEGWRRYRCWILHPRAAFAPAWLFSRHR